MNAADDLLTLKGLELFLLAHKAIRNEFTRLLACVPRLSYADAGNQRASAMGEWLERVQALIESHHSSEDDTVYPMLVAKDPTWAEHETRLAADHEQLDPMLAAVRSGFEALASASAPTFVATRDALVESLTRLDTHMCDHLEREEAAMLPAFTSTVTYGELEALERASAKGTPMSTMMLILPWILDAASEGERASWPPSATLSSGPGSPPLRSPAQKKESSGISVKPPPLPIARVPKLSVPLSSLACTSM